MISGQFCLVEGRREHLNTSRDRAVQRDVSRLMVWFKEGNIDSENTYSILDSTCQQSHQLFINFRRTLSP